MNILQLAKDMEDSGVTSYIIGLSRYLIKKGKKVVVLSSGGAHVKELDRLGIEHYFIPVTSRNPFRQIKNVFELIKLIRKEKIEIAHTHWRSTGILMKVASIFTGIDFVWSNHANHIRSSIFHNIFTFHGKRTITVSNDLVPMLTKIFGIPRSKLSVVLTGIDSELYVEFPAKKKQAIRAQYDIKKAQKVICLLGRLSPVKGHLFLLDALREMADSSEQAINYKILLTGNGPDDYKEEIIQKAESLGLLDKIVFTGWVNPVDVLNISDLMVLPSITEGFPIVCIEAFALRVPVIRTRVGGFSDMKDHCIGVDYGDVQALSRAMLEVLSDEKKTSVMVNRAHQFYKQQLTAETMVDKLLKIYQE